MNTPRLLQTLRALREMESVIRDAGGTVTMERLLTMQVADLMEICGCNGIKFYVVKPTPDKD